MSTARNRSGATKAAKRPQKGASRGGQAGFSAFSGFSLRRALRWAALLAAGGALLGAAVVAGLFIYYTADPSLPAIDRAGDYHPKVSTRVLCRDGQLAGEIFDERRTVVPIGRIPQVVIHAFVDAEDAQFFEHGGLNYWGMLRALLHDLRPGAHLHGASTITQQLVRTYVLHSDARTLRRKFQEMYLARHLERRLSKDEILWIYLNQIYFGHGRYGIEEAARFYFGKSVSEVNPGEAAMLGSLPKGPEEISPRRNQERAKDRQRYVLSQMLRYGHVSKADAERYASEPIKLVPEPPSLAALAPEFVDEVERFLVGKYGAPQVPYLGLNVRTTCDLDVQRAARAALEKGLRDLDEREGLRKGLGRHESAPGPQIVLGTIDKVTDAEHGDPGAVVKLASGTGWLPLPLHGDRYNPRELPPRKRFSPGDTVRVRVAHTGKDGPVLALENGPQGAVVVIEPGTRQVLALVGGYGFTRGGYNRATRAKRQPGSSFKPFLYAAAFDSRQYTPATILNDSPQIYGMPGMDPWKPKNAETEGFLGPVRLRVALAKSLNSVASQIIYADGGALLGKVVEIAHAAGITSQLEPNPSLALGTSVVSPWELTNAYATFAAAGMRADPITLLQVGEEQQPAPAPVQAISPELAFVVTSVLQSVISEGTAASARDRLRRPAAGKTGTTNDQKDAWFIGYTPDLAAGVWVGFDDMRPLGRHEQGARAALPVWVELMQQALRGRRPEPFIQPAGVVVERIDPQTGKLAAPGAPAIDEVFLDGTQPTEQALAPGEESPDTFNQVP